MGEALLSERRLVLEDVLAAWARPNDGRVEAGSTDSPRPEMRRRHLLLLLLDGRRLLLSARVEEGRPRTNDVGWRRLRTEETCPLENGLLCADRGILDRFLSERRCNEPVGHELGLTGGVGFGKDLVRDVGRLGDESRVRMLVGEPEALLLNGLNDSALSGEHIAVGFPNRVLRLLLEDRLRLLARRVNVCNCRAANEPARTRSERLRRDAHLRARRERVRRLLRPRRVVHDRLKARKARLHWRLRLLGLAR